MKTSLFLAAAMIAATLPATAFAQAGDDTRSIKLSYRDLDLGGEAGRQSLDRRIGGAVVRLCGRAINVTLEEAVESRRCTRQARSAALASERLAIARAMRVPAAGRAIAAR